MGFLLSPFAILKTLAGLVVAAFLAWGSFKGYVAYQRFDAARQATAILLNELKAKTALEGERRNQVLDAARKNAERLVEAAEASAAQNSTTLRKIDNVAKDRAFTGALLDARGVQLLDDIRRKARR